jgi:heme-degrading monooxygenase HmoA
MYIGSIHYSFQKDRMDEGMWIWKEYVLPEAQKQAGFKGADLFLDETTGEAFDIGFWETEEDARKYEESGMFELVAERMRPMFSKPPSRRQYKVIHHHH